MPGLPCPSSSARCISSATVAHVCPRRPSSVLRSLISLAVSIRTLPSFLAQTLLGDPLPYGSVVWRRFPSNRPSILGQRATPPLRPRPNHGTAQRNDTDNRNVQTSLVPSHLDLVLNNDQGNISIKRSRRERGGECLLLRTVHRPTWQFRLWRTPLHPMGHRGLGALVQNTYCFLCCTFRLCHLNFRASVSVVSVCGVPRQCRTLM